jgi:Cytochrome C oxidase, cbb3-type, subunit III
MKRFIEIINLVCLIIILMGCYRGRPSENPPVHLNPNMDDQPRYNAQASSQFFEDSSAMRRPVEGTVARGELREDNIFYEGKNQDGSLVKKNPLPLTMDLLNRGQQRFNIYCSPCHDLTGSGRGIVVKKGFLPPPTFHQQRLREVEDGHIFDVISNGIRNMPTYRHQIPVIDRWAIVTYVRSLQRSQNAQSTDIPEEMREKVK